MRFNRRLFLDGISAFSSLQCYLISGPEGRAQSVQKPAARFTKYLMTILRRSYHRLIYKTSYTGYKAFLKYSSLAKS